jgi:hypothetical protein
LGHFYRRNPVDQRMVGASDDRELAVFETVKNVHLPQRATPVEAL